MLFAICTTYLRRLNTMSTTGKRVPILTERANAAIASSRKRRLSLSSQEGTDDIPRQRARTSESSPAMGTTAVNDSDLSPTTLTNTPHHAAEAPEGTDETEGDADDTISVTDSDISNSSSVPAAAGRETPEVQLSMLKSCIIEKYVDQLFRTFAERMACTGIRILPTNAENC